MQQLLLLLYQYRATLIFILFEVFCAWLIVQNNYYQQAQFLNSSNAVAANILGVQSNISEYFGLKQVNQQLAEENAALRARLLLKQNDVIVPDTSELKVLLNADSLQLISSDSLKLIASVKRSDSVVAIPYDLITAKVISNSIRRINNYITVNKGSDDGVEWGMGVISPNGVVGNVKAVSKNFAVINSLLHSDIRISAKIKRTEDLGTIRWEGTNFTKALLNYVPRHVQLQTGDTVVTSGFNALFPPGIMIGVVEEIEEREESQFYDIVIDLSVDFNELSYVYIIHNRMRDEIDSLKTEAIEWSPQE